MTEMDSGTLKLILFCMISCWLLYLSWKSLRVAGSHGSYRFFAWEAILALVFLNIPVWCTDPFSFLQLVSWLLLLVSLIMLVPGGVLLLFSGKPTNERKDDTLMGFEKTTSLVTTGIYRYIRHPLYGSLMFLAWGAFLKGVSLASILLIAAATILLFATSKADERECVRYFGPAYEEYMGRTKMFIPFLL